jgi:hypothetical protein
MNPKCPWCGERMNAGKGVMDSKWYAYCGNQNCPVKNKGHDTKSEALAAASKRFMPKRSVEEICKKFMEFVATRERDEKKFDCKTRQEKDFISCKLFIWQTGMAKLCARIADYMTGVTE